MVGAWGTGRDRRLPERWEPFLHAPLHPRCCCRCPHAEPHTPLEQKEQVKAGCAFDTYWVLLASESETPCLLPMTHPSINPPTRGFIGPCRRQSRTGAELRSPKVSTDGEGAELGPRAQGPARYTLPHCPAPTWPLPRSDQLHLTFPPPQALAVNTQLLLGPQVCPASPVLWAQHLYSCELGHLMEVPLV